VLRRELLGYKQLGLTHNPYRLRAGDFAPEDIRRVFTGRGRQLKKLSRAIISRRNALLHGTYGIGKTFLLRYFLEECKRSDEPKVVCDYCPFIGRSEEDLLNTVAYVMAGVLKDEDKDAKRIWDRMKGVEEQKGKVVRGEVGVLVKGGASRENRKTWTSELSKPYLANVVKDLSARWCKNRLLVIGIDELDKRSLGDFKKLMRESRYLFEIGGLSLVVVGAPAFVESDVVTSEFGAFDACIEVPPLEESELVTLAERYSALAGKNPFDRPSLQRLAEFSFGVPRLMIALCAGAVEGAVDLGAKRITVGNLERVLQRFGEEIYARLNTAQRKLVRLIHSQKGVLKGVDEEIAKRLGVTRPTVYQHVDALMRSNALAEVVEDDKRTYRLNLALSAFLKKRG
jgi:Cdc6-like AAA superfamily ATPase